LRTRASYLWLIGLALVGCSGPSIQFDGNARPRAAGETRALVLWVRFSDDTRDLSGAATESQQDWAEPDRLPTLAGRILSGSVRRPRGLTEYFLAQSQGRFRLTGRSYPDVLVSREPEASYRAPNGTLDQGRLTRELLERVDADKRIDLEDFDADRDGFIDYVFVVIRGMSETRLYPSHASGVSDLGYTSEIPEFGRRGRLRLDRNASGSYVRYDDAGNIFAQIDLVRLMAHEIGHDLWTDWVHLRPVLPVRGVPPFASRQVGYALMAGASDARGDETISAYERDVLGWISCKRMTSDTLVVVGDLYSSSGDNCFTMAGVQFQPRGRPRRLYVSYRQRIGPFDRLLHEEAPQARSDQGLMDTGILVMATSADGRVGPVPADGDLGLSPHAAAYRGDLFQAGSRLTPWTVPNSSGLLGFPRGLTEAPEALYQGLHILDAAGQSGMRLHYRPDERVAARFEDGDVLPSLPGLRFSGGATVRGRVVLEGDASFRDSLTVRRFSTLKVSGTLDTALLVLGDGATLRVDGSVVVSRARTGRRARVIVGADGTISGAGAQALRAAEK
jgi:M6 family metalloprotease-like protein